MKEMERLLGVLGQTPLLTEQHAAAEELRRRVEGSEVTIAVMGQFKRGKSSLINAMLGEELLPVGIIPLTTVVTELRWGKRFHGEVCFSDGSKRELEKGELADYCSEALNPGNRKQVETVRIKTPGQPFGPGFVLVDTPGVGSVHRHNTESSSRYVERSDGVLFLLSVDSPISEIERAFLLRARTYAAKFFFAVNKTDTVSADDLDSFLTFCTCVLSEAMDQPVRLYPVSAKTGQGMPELTQMLREELKTSGDALLTASAEKKLELLREQARAKLMVALRAAALPAQELKARLERLRTERSRLEGFGEEIRVLAAHRTGQLVDQIEVLLRSRSGQILRETEKKGRELADKLSGLPARKFEVLFRRELEELLREELNELHREGLALLERGYGQLAALLTDKASAAASFLSSVVEEEFGLIYPVPEICVQVTERSDFTLHLGSGGSLLLDMEAISRLLPRKQANRRYYLRNMEQAARDIERNRNNMLSNYRYKMQESLRPLCRELSEQVETMAEEMDGLIEHISSHLRAAGERRCQEEHRLQELLAQL